MEPPLQGKSPGLHKINLLNENGRINDGAVGNDQFTVWIQDSAWHQVEGQLFSLDNDRVAGIRPTIEANDHVVFGGQDVNKFSFAFVSPLQPDNRGVWCARLWCHPVLL